MNNTRFIKYNGKNTKYIVFDTGEVFSIEKQKFLTKYIAGKGYYYVHLSIDGEKINRSVHRLVAEAFIPNPENKRTVNHKDGNKLNNHVSNLEWATYSENNKHMKKMIREGWCQPCEQIKSDSKKEYEKNMLPTILKVIELLETTDMSCSKIAKRFNMSANQVNDIYNKKTWKKYTKDKNFIYRGKSTTYSKYTNDIYDLVLENPRLKCKEICSILNIVPDKQIKYLIENTKRNVKLHTSSTTNKMRGGGICIHINLDNAE